MLRRILVSLALLGLFLVPLATTIEAAPPRPVLATWYSCRLTFNSANTMIVHRACITYGMPRATHTPTGWWIAREVNRSRHTGTSVRYPTFWLPKPTATPAPAPVSRPAPVQQRPISGGQIMWAPVTGYSWGCGTPNGITASGTVPSVGTVANDWLPFGTRVYIPSLGYSGVVLDRGQGHGGFDLFAPSCGATFAYTGYREIIIG